MIGEKTEAQQQCIVEKRVDTANAEPGFDPRPELQASDKPGDEG